MPSAHNLRAVREQRMLSQTELAARTGVMQSTISRIEGGQPARYITIRKLATALDVAPTELIGPVPGTATNGAITRRAATADGDRAALALAQLLDQAERARARGDEEAAARFEAIAGGMVAP